MSHGTVNSLLSLWLCLLAFGLAQESTSKVTVWDRWFDSLSEYSTLLSFSAPSNVICLMKASVSTADAADFSEEDELCRLYRCRWGPSGCRKCRYVSQGARLWLRRPTHLDRKFCWRTFQHRVDGSVRFDRNWAEYRASFGQDEHRNFWLGLDAIHAATEDGLRRVRWELRTWQDQPFWAENKRFLVAGSDKLYRLLLGPLDSSLSSMGQCSFTDMKFLNNQSFYTFDIDNDNSSVNCARVYDGGWWFNSCACFNPNGLYYQYPDAYNKSATDSQGIFYFWPGAPYPFRYEHSMKEFECLFTDFI